MEYVACSDVGFGCLLPEKKGDAGVNVHSPPVVPVALKVQVAQIGALPNNFMILHTTLLLYEKRVFLFTAYPVCNIVQLPAVFCGR